MAPIKSDRWSTIYHGPGNHPDTVCPSPHAHTPCPDRYRGQTPRCECGHVSRAKCHQTNERTAPMNAQTPTEREDREANEARDQRRAERIAQVAATEARWAEATRRAQPLHVAPEGGRVVVYQINPDESDSSGYASILFNDAPPEYEALRLRVWRTQSNGWAAHLYWPGTSGPVTGYPSFQSAESAGLAAFRATFPHDLVVDQSVRGWTVGDHEDAQERARYEDDVDAMR